MQIRRLPAQFVAVAFVLAPALAACGDDGNSEANRGASTPAGNEEHPTVDTIVDEMTAAEGLTLLTAATTTVIDVRTPAEFAEGHLVGARNVDFQAADFRERADALAKDAPYFVYCRSGNRSSQAVAIMAELGFGEIHHLSDGILGWEAAGNPLVTN